MCVIVAGATGRQGGTGATGSSGPANTLHDVTTASPCEEGPRGDVLQYTLNQCKNNMRLI